MTGSTRIAIVPTAPALLPRYAGLRDPLPELRTACLDAVSWLVTGDRDEEVVVLCPMTAAGNAEGTVGASRGPAVAEYLLAAAGHRGGYELVVLGRRSALPDLAGRAVLTLAHGTARRSEGSSGHVDGQVRVFDEAIDTALRAGDLAALGNLDPDLGADLLAEGTPVLRALGAWVARVDSAEVTFDGDPFGVQYWVARLLCASRAPRPAPPTACPHG